jgi:hypothetical protein
MRIPCRYEILQPNYKYEYYDGDVVGFVGVGDDAYAVIEQSTGYLCAVKVYNVKLKKQ